MNILQVLSDWSCKFPTKKVWNFIDDNGKEVDNVTYLELSMITDDLANELLSGYGLKSGDRALLVFFPGLDFMITLLACFKAKIIAVPVFPPDPRKLHKDIHHFVSIYNSSGAQFALTHNNYNFAKKISGLKNIFSSNGGSWPKVTWIVVDDTIKASKKAVSKKNTSGINFNYESTHNLNDIGDEIAFLQYTSGSTSEPKGVMISHNNLSHNEKIIGTSLKTDKDTVCVSWLPQYHDMGLIGSYLGTVYCGGEGYFLSPLSFLRDPLLWLKTLSKYQATHTQAPSFAYALVSRKLREYNNRSKEPLVLDLSKLEHSINAAEPVDPVVLRDFREQFAVYGLKPETVVPTYGLAEHTVFVCSGGKQILNISKKALEKDEVVVLSQTSSPKADNRDSDCRSVVGCGYPRDSENVDVKIVSNNGLALDEDKVGEIWVDSPSKAKGYWGRGDNQEEFNGTVNDNNASGIDHSYLRTGDLGFFHKDELFVCGRLKDLLIIRGTNHYPQDIERTVEKLAPAQNKLRPGCTAAFTVTDSKEGQEELVILAESREGVASTDLEQLLSLSQEAVMETHGIGISKMCILKTRTLPKTTSGKIARAWCKIAFENKKLEIVVQSDYSNSNNNSNNSSAMQLLTKSDVDEGTIGTLSSATGSSIMGNGSRVGPIPDLSPQQVRGMSINEISDIVESLLLVVTMDGPVALQAPIDRSCPIRVLGLDSLLLIQFSGSLQNRLHCKIPDEFLFLKSATITVISEVCKRGALTAAQEKELEDAQANPDVTTAESVEVISMEKQPACPWFYLCMKRSSKK